jgi:glycosyltransferase involved in cell wall biosynthesis
VSKILWLGDGGCHTGFAKVTHSIGERLVRDYGHTVDVLASNYDGDPWPTNLNLWRTNKFVPGDLYGQSRFVELLGSVEPDVVVILNDPNIVLDLILKNKYDPHFALLKYRPILSYIPIDGINHPPSWAPTLHKVSKVVAMSEHGQRELTVADSLPALVYHGVDTERFHPASLKDPLTLSNGTVVRSQNEAKAAFGWSKKDFVVLRVDKNSGRKDYPASWSALVPFMQRHPNVRVHWQCEGKGGIEIEAMLSREPELHSRFHLPNPATFNSFQGWPEQDLAALYNAADVFISTSRGEGFGLTIAEALACGTPVIAQNVSAIPEVVGPGGILIDPVRLITTPSGKDNWLADIDEFTDALERLYASSGARRKLGEAARSHIVKTFSWDVETAKMDGLIAELIASGEKAAALISEGATSDDDPSGAVSEDA